MKKESLYSLILVLLCTSFSTVYSQTPLQGSVVLSANAVGGTTPFVALQWVKEPTATEYNIYRRENTSSSFSLLTNLPASLNTWIDSNASEGVAYEYAVESKLTISSKQTRGCGFVMAGANVSAAPVRGRILLLVDSVMYSRIAADVDILEADLWKEGWIATRQSVARTERFNKDAVQTVKKLVKDWYALDKSIPATVFILGRVAVPYSGMMKGNQLVSGPDGHLEHIGAWAADMYYASINNESLWTDLVKIDTIVGQFDGDPQPDTVSINMETRNYPGDGKFDNSEFPDYLSLRIGRVDLYNMGLFYTKTKMVGTKQVIDSLESEADLLHLYLERNHSYRSGAMQYQWRALIDDNFGTYGERFARSGWMSFGPLVGAANIKENNRDGVDFFKTLDTASYLWAYGCGGGSFTSCGGIGNSIDFKTYKVNSVFTMLFGSYFGDWDHANDFLRAPLASKPSVLTCAWAGRPNWYFHTMAMGATTGDAALLSQNSDPYFRQFFAESMIGQYSVTAALMGDPSLRLNYGTVPPPQNLSVLQVLTPKKGVELKWNAPSTAVTGYYLYRKQGDDPIEVLNDGELVSGTSFFDEQLYEGTVRYVVRSVGVLKGGTGSFNELSTPIQQDARITSVDELTELGTTLHCYPNPSRGSINIEFSTSSPARVRVEVLNSTGALVRRLANVNAAAGSQQLVWDLNTDVATQVAEGIYLIRVALGNKVYVHKVSVVY